MDLYGVSLTLPGSAGGLTLISADTVAVDFQFTEALGAVSRLRKVTVRRPEVYSMAGTDTAAGDGSGTIELSLPTLRIDELIVSDAFAEISDSRGRLSERILEADWRGAVTLGTEVEADLDGCRVVWETHNSQLADLRGRVKINNRGVFVDSLSGMLNEAAVRARGHRLWDNSLDIWVDGRGVSVAEVEDLIDQSIGFNAAGDVVGTFVMTGDTLVYDGVFSGDLEGYRADGLDGRVVVTPTAVLIEDMQGRINEASFTGGGLFDITDSEAVTFFLEGDVTDVDMSQGLVPGEQDLPVTDGRGRLRIEHSDDPLWTRVTGVLEDGFIEIMPFDTCYVDVEATGDSVVFNRVEVFYRDLHALLEGASDSAQVFRGYASINSEDITTLPDTWNWPPMTGRMNGQGALRGVLEDLQFAGFVNIYDYSLGPLAAGASEIALVVDDVLEDRSFTAGVDGRDFALGGVPFGDYSLWGSASATGAQVDSFRTSLGDTAVHLVFRADYADSISRILVEEFTLALEGTEWGIDAAVPFSISPDHFSLPRLRVQSDQGALEVNGLFERDRVVAGDLKLENFDLGLLNPFLRDSTVIGGRMTADVVVGGEPASPQVNLTLDLVDAPFPLADVHAMHVTAGISGGVVDFRELDLRTQYGRVTGRGTVANPDGKLQDFWPGADLDLDLTFIEGNFAFLDQFQLPALDRIDGWFNGKVAVRGSTDDPLITGTLDAEPFHVHWLHLDKLTGSIRVDSEGLVLGDLAGNKYDLGLTGRIEVPLALDLMSEPVTPENGPFFMQIDIPWDSDLSALSAATNAFVTAGGRGGAHVIISGPLDHPLYQGTVEVRDASFVMRNLQEVYREVSCDGILQGDELKVFNINGREGLRGKFSGEGVVLFQGLEMKTFDIRLDLERFLVASIPDLAVVVSGTDGRMTGVKVGPDSLLVPKFSGEFDVHKARYVGDFSEGGSGVDPRQATVAPDWLADIRLHAQPRVAHIVNREMELDMGGDLNLVRNQAGLTLRGSLDVNKGRLIVFNNNFEVQRGRLDFSSELGFDPRLDLDAQTKYRMRSQYSSNSIIEVIGVHVAGTLLQPEVTFSSERGYSKEAIQRMLLGLEPHATPEGDSSGLTNTSIAAGFNLLEREIARELDIFDTFEIDQIQRQRETGNSGLDPLIGVGKYIGSDLYLKYAQGIRGEDQDFIVEYQINQHLLLQSEVRRRIDENQGNATYNLDFKYRFEY
jgi:hypothetical protein